MNKEEITPKIVDGNIHLPLTAEEKIEMIEFYFDCYFNTDQDVEEFASEYYYLTKSIISGQIPCQLEFLTGYKELMANQFPGYAEVLNQGIDDSVINRCERKGETPNTKINYLYRDGSNYKVHNEAVVEGILSKEQIGEIIACLDEGEYFIPSKVGLPERKFDEEDSEDDHPWFELNEDDFEVTEEVPTVSTTARELHRTFCARKNKWLKDW